MHAGDDGKGSDRQVPVQDLHMTPVLIGPVHMDRVSCGGSMTAAACVVNIPLICCEPQADTKLAITCSISIVTLHPAWQTQRESHNGV